MAAKPRAVKVPPAPEKLEDLSRDGLIHLARTYMWGLSRRELISARWHELVRAAERATNAWRAEQDKVDLVLAETPLRGLRFGSSAYHKAEAKVSEARERAQRAWDASERAYCAAQAFYEQHMEPAFPPASAPPVEQGAEVRA